MKYKIISKLYLLAGLTIIPAGIGCYQPVIKPINVLFVVGGQHHDYDSEPATLAQRLTERGDLNIDLTADLTDLHPSNIERYQVLMFNTCHEDRIDDESRQAILEHVRAGKGLVALHCSLWSYQDWPQWAEMLGGLVLSHDKRAPLPLTVLDPSHEITLGQGRHLELKYDEPYLVDNFDPEAEVLIRTTQIHTDRQKNQRRSGPEPQVWIKQYGAGRVFVVTFGHDNQTLTDERFISLMHNGIRFSAKRLPPASHNTLTLSEKKDGYELLFNGKDLTGWSGTPENWSVENGELVGRAADLKHNIFLSYTRKQYADFILRFSAKLINHNSGVQFRSRQFPEHVVKGYQADAADKWWGSLYDEGTGRGVLVNGFKDKGEHVVIPDGWNQMTIKAVGTQITIRLNGLITAKYEEKDPSIPTSGIIALQLHRGPPMEVRFRDIKIRPLEK
ncbi:MAG: DUF1080 domain-containing protein [Planctomycetota bacterium]|nr:MAG: DUF1080 domain-containing protein [Planctomycetota bacterium]